MERRFKIAWLPQESVLILMGGWFGYSHVSLPILTLPGGERCGTVDVTYSWERQAFGFKLYHESFPEVPICEPIPPLDFNVTLRLIRLNYQPQGSDEPMTVTVLEDER